MSSEKSTQPMVGSAEHLKLMSGYKQKTSVARWCRQNKIQFFLDARGWPTTTPAAIDRALSPGVESGPDFGSIGEWTKTSTHWRHKRLREQEAAKPAPQPSPRKKAPPK